MATNRKTLTLPRTSTSTNGATKPAKPAPLPITEIAAKHHDTKADAAEAPAPVNPTAGVPESKEPVREEITVTLDIAQRQAAIAVEGVLTADAVAGKSQVEANERLAAVLKYKIPADKVVEYAAKANPELHGKLYYVDKEDGKTKVTSQASRMNSVASVAAIYPEIVKTADDMIAKAGFPCNRVSTVQKIVSEARRNKVDGKPAIPGGNKLNECLMPIDRKAAGLTSKPAVPATSRKLYDDAVKALTELSNRKYPVKELLVKLGEIGATIPETTTKKTAKELAAEHAAKQAKAVSLMEQGQFDQAMMLLKRSNVA
jgi:hypothetical protein